MHQIYESGSRSKNKPSKEDNYNNYTLGRIPESHAHSGILVRGVMYSQVTWPEESCTVRYPEPWSHAQSGILAQGLRESCTVRYPGPWSHVQSGSMVRGVMYSQVPWPGESRTVRYPEPWSHAQ